MQKLIYCVRSRHRGVTEGPGLDDRVPDPEHSADGGDAHDAVGSEHAGLLTTLYLNLVLARGVDVLRLRTAIEAVLHRQNQVPLSPDFNDWLDPAKNPRPDEIAAIRHFLGMA
ncbi:MAG TPA: hypothetical protein VEL75_14415 [Candidatus Methylomirabilis sp.]|nr:hypothetical protein [Candidatus Methylomirabilis sp.]